MNEQLLHVCMYVYELLLISVILCPDYVRFFLSFDWSVCMSPGGTGSRKSQMSMVSSFEPLTIWKSSICRPYTPLECSCDKQVRISSHGQATHEGVVIGDSF